MRVKKDVTNDNVNKNEDEASNKKGPTPQLNVNTDLQTPPLSTSSTLEDGSGTPLIFDPDEFAVDMDMMNMMMYGGAAPFYPSSMYPTYGDYNQTNQYIDPQLYKQFMENFNNPLFSPEGSTMDDDSLSNSGAGQNTAKVHEENNTPSGKPTGASLGPNFENYSLKVKVRHPERAAYNIVGKLPDTAIDKERSSSSEQNLHTSNAVVGPTKQDTELAPGTSQLSPNAVQSQHLIDKKVAQYIIDDKAMLSLGSTPRQGDNDVKIVQVSGLKSVPTIKVKQERTDDIQHIFATPIPNGSIVLKDGTLLIPTSNQQTQQASIAANNATSSHISNPEIKHIKSNLDSQDFVTTTDPSNQNQNFVLISAGDSESITSSDVGDSVAFHNMGITPGNPRIQQINTLSKASSNPYSQNTLHTQQPLYMNKVRSGSKNMNNTTLDNKQVSHPGTFAIVNNEVDNLNVQAQQSNRGGDGYRELLPASPTATPTVGNNVSNNTVTQSYIVQNSAYKESHPWVTPPNVSNMGISNNGNQSMGKKKTRKSKTFINNQDLNVESENENDYSTSPSKRKKSKLTSVDTITDIVGAVNEDLKEDALLKEAVSKPIKHRVDLLDVESSMERTVKNAVNARVNRQKHKLYVQTLEEENTKLKSNVNSLQSENDILIQEKDLLNKEVVYLKSVLANQSVLSNVFSNLKDIKSVNLTSSFAQKFSSKNSNDSVKDSSVVVRKSKTSGGVCIHVSGNNASLEMCEKCAEMASEGH